MARIGCMVSTTPVIPLQGCSTSAPQEAGGRSDQPSPSWNVPTRRNSGSWGPGVAGGKTQAQIKASTGASPSEKAWATSRNQGSVKFCAVHQRSKPRQSFLASNREARRQEARPAGQIRRRTVTILQPVPREAGMCLSCVHACVDRIGLGFSNCVGAGGPRGPRASCAATLVLASTETGRSRCSVPVVPVKTQGHGPVPVDRDSVSHGTYF